MTDRYKGFTVVLEEDMRSDDAEATLNAIRQIRGVLSVTPLAAAIGPDFIAEERVRHEMWRKIGALFFPQPEPRK